MNSELLVMLYEQLLLVEGLLLGMALGALLWRHNYLLNRRRRETGHERGLEARPALGARAPDSPELGRRLCRVR